MHRLYTYIHTYIQSLETILKEDSVSKTQLTATISRLTEVSLYTICMSVCVYIHTYIYIYMVCIYVRYVYV
jgi:hypothetical protein